jgi:hypothetical protein
VGGKEFAHHVYSVLVEFKAAKWRPDGSLELYKLQPPRITNPKVAEWATILGRLLPRIVGAVGGRR